MTSSDGWTWEFTAQAATQFESLDPHVQDRIVSKLDEIVTSEWRDPRDFLDPLIGSPFQKLRIGQYRLACVLSRGKKVLEIHRIEHRRGAYTADDDEPVFGAMRFWPSLSEPRAWTSPSAHGGSGATGFASWSARPLSTPGI